MERVVLSSEVTEISRGPTLRALSVRQPWASLIRDGVKTVELRSWRTNHRGSLVIVSSKRKFAEHPVGVVVAVVDVVGCRAVEVGDAERACLTPEQVTEYSYAWILRNPRPTAYVSRSGSLGLWRIPERCVTIV